MIVTHTKISSIADGGDTSLVRASDWNANHTIDTGNISGFRAYSTTAQSIPTTTFTKIQFNVEEYDILSEYDSTNFRFTPQEAGRYLCNSNVHILLQDAKQGVLILYKNSSEYLRGNRILAGSAGGIGLGLSAIVNLTTSNYLEMYIYHTCTSASPLEQPNIYWDMIKMA